MSRAYGARLYRALYRFRDQDGAPMWSATEPPAPYEDVERWVLAVATGAPVEGRRIERVLIVEVPA